MNNNETERLLTVSEVADLLSVPASWVYTQVASKRVPHLHVGRYVRFVRADLVAWLKASSETS